MADIADEVRIPGPQGPQGDTGPQGPQGEPGESVYNVRFDVESFCFTCDSTGKAWGEKVAATIHLTYGEEELPFTIVSIGNDGSQIAATIKGKTIYFESLKGVKIDEGGNIPVVIRYRATTGTAIGFNNYAIGYSNKPIGYLNYAGENKDFTVYFNYSTVRAGANKGLLTEINDYLSAGGTRYKGDYFTWGGPTTGVTYGGVTYTFLKGRVYSWNGYQWAESIDDGEISDSFNNVMSVLDDEIVSNNSKLEQTMRKLSAVTVFCEELATKVAFINKLFTQNITMQNGGLFKSAYWNGDFDQGLKQITAFGATGWALDSTGQIDLVNAHISGDSEIEGLLKQGTNVYFATRITIRNHDGVCTITCSNPDYQDKVMRSGTGQYQIVHTGFKAYGTPRIITNYASDKEKTDRDILSGYFGSGDFSWLGTDPKYQLQCHGCGNYFIYDSGMQLHEYYPFVFTDNNTDQYIDPAYAVLTLYYL